MIIPNFDSCVLVNGRAWFGWWMFREIGWNWEMWREEGKDSFVKLKILNRLLEEKPKRRRTFERMLRGQKGLRWDTNASGVSRDMGVNNSTRWEVNWWISVCVFDDTEGSLKFEPERLWNYGNREWLESCEMQEFVNDVGTMSKCKSSGLFPMKRPFGVCEMCFDQSSATKAWKYRKCELRFGDQISIRREGCNTPYLIIPI